MEEARDIAAMIADNQNVPVCADHLNVAFGLGRSARVGRLWAVLGLKRCGCAHAEDTINREASDAPLHLRDRRSVPVLSTGTEGSG